MILITESKRDDLLIPYYNAVKAFYPELTLGKFKTMMLEKLAAQGGINNLSLSSNYYLAGATRYYFQGKLTMDGKAQILSGDYRKPDQWNVDVCKRLNALVEILRNSYIDSVGTAFEQPEDFGELPLDKLLKKYGKKINEVLGITTEKEKPEPEDTLDRNPVVGKKGYTFDILYTFEQATQYNRYTTPGAWCITYGRNHFDYYIQRLGIHYVIFRKEGFENVPRKHDENFTPQKPHDAYGNSLIAFLQSNANPNGVFITSRWNHGYEESIEADHAYTMDEFMKITGVSAEDLRRIYLIWKNDSKNYRNGQNNEDRAKTRKEEKAAYLGTIRKFKYAQMVVNGGESPQKAFELAGLEWVRSEGLVGDYREPKKAIMLYQVKDGERDSRILVDRNKFLFETVPWPGQEDMVEIYTAKEELGAPNGAFDGLIIIGKEDNYMLYNSRFHEFVNIGGITKFKRLPKTRISMGENTEIKYIEIKNGMKDVALLSASTCRPVKLPNGQYWFNDIFWANNRSWERGGQIHCHVITKEIGPVVEITYDESSGEKYFLDINSGKFLNWILNLKDPEGGNKEPILFDESITGFNNYISIAFRDRGRKSRWGREITDSARIFTLDGRMVHIYGRSRLDDACGAGGRFLSFDQENNTQPTYYYSRNESKYIYDCVTKKLIAAGDNPILTKSKPFFRDNYYNREEIAGARVAYIQLTGRLSDYYAVYDLQTGLLFKNTVGFMEKGCPYAFKLYETALQDKLLVWKDECHPWKLYQQLSDLTPEELKKRYGVDDAWEAKQIEEKKHVVAVQFDNLQTIPNDMPENNEFEAEQPTEEPMAAPMMAESEIKEIVKKSIREAIEKL